MEYRYQLAHDKYKILYIQFLVIYSLFRKPPIKYPLSLYL